MEDMKMNGFWRQLAVIGGFLAVTVGMSWPVAAHLQDKIAGEGGDPWQTMWRFEENWEDLRGAEGVSGIVREEWLGGGEARLVNLSAWPWVWAQGLFGQPMAYNVVWLLSFAASGYAMYWLVKWLVRERQGELEISDWQIEAGAMIAGLYYMLLPYHVAHAMGHFGAMQIQWLPLAVLGWLAWLKRPGIGKAVGLGAVLGLQAWSEHHYALWMAVFMLVSGVWYWRNIRNSFKKAAGWGSAAVLGLLVVGLLVVPYWPTVRLAVSSKTSALELGVQQTTRFSADLLAFVTPSPFNPLWGEFVQRVVTSRFTGNFAEGVESLGLAVLLLIIFFHQKVPVPVKRFWLVMGGVFSLIALGPVLHVFGVVTNIPLPYVLVGWLPVFDAVRTVSRAGVMVGLSMAVLVGWVVATQVHRRGAVWALVGLIGFGFMFWPMRMQAWDTSGVYEAAKELTGSRIVELPAATNYVVASKALYESRYHGKEVVGSIALERGQDEAVLEEVRSLPALRQLLYLRTTHLGEGRQDFFAQDLSETLRDVLGWLDATGVIVHWDSLSPVQQETVRGLLENGSGEWVRSDYGDDSLYVWNKDKEGESDGVFIARDGSWANVGFDPKRNSVFAEVEDTAGLTVYNSGAERTVALEFDLPPESHEDFRVSASGAGEANPVVTDRHVRVLVTAPAQGKAQVEVENMGAEKLIIQDPKYIVCSNENTGC